MKKNKLFLTVAFSFLIVIATAQYQKCGTWRWGIKTLTDGQASAILKTSPVTVSIEALTVKYPFNHKLSVSSDKNLERQADEKQLVKVSCYIVGLKEEKSSGGDHDFHIILKSPDSDSTMVAEIPSPDCPEAAADPQLKKIYTQLRQWVCDNIITPTSTLKYVDPVAVDIVGVPFWDMPSHGSGASYYGREIHPVINIAKAGTMLNAEPVHNNSGTMSSDAALTSNNLPYGLDTSKINEPASSNQSHFVFDKATIIALVAAGYAGTDLIEGFIVKRA